ncbi:MAG: TrpR YerC/YecD [Clostridiales bacterium]|nr:TrpR YerC/YecD [Clostridiales bacterium]MBS5877383.1 TrpR YerC/YecD [Clostridiales bacterium]MDU0939224.1 YerC/YecD family TrpR-related protein [Clostridiales bacterium]MDU1042131.1 YerC/YecD family TrpR-related protein [Clostridiales bacterium]MDU3490485.1 YerC/YecD family TrpR-related protein [Clostridiales bacterium]
MIRKKNNGEYQQLYEAILSLETMDECRAFLEDICTINEVDSLAQRLEVAKMLRASKTYLDIASETGASTATISRVNRALNYGSDGYDVVLKRINN